MTENEIIKIGVQVGLCDEFGDINMEYEYKDKILAFAKLLEDKIKSNSDYAAATLDEMRRRYDEHFSKALKKE